MHYVEILRARRVLLWYTLVLLAGLAITAATVFGGGHVSAQGIPPVIDFAEIVLGCAVGALIVATCVAPGLIAEASTIGITWTRPAPRAQIAWRFIAVDVAAIAIAYLALIAAGVVGFGIFGLLGALHVGLGSVTTYLLGLGSAVMLYALVALASSRLPGRGGLIAGLSWVVFILVGTLWAAPLPQPLHVVLTALNYLNPFAWIEGISGGDARHVATHPITLAFGLRLAIVWLLALGFLGTTVRLWSTREV